MASQEMLSDPSFRAYDFELDCWKKCSWLTVDPLVLLVEELASLFAS